MRSSMIIKFKFLFSILLFLVFLGACYSYRNRMIFNSISANIDLNRIVEFGSDNFDSLDMVSNVSGDISILRDVNIDEVGHQVVLFEIKKSNVKKQIPVLVEVVDNAAPIIEINNKIVYIKSGIDYDLKSNIKNVVDNVDGELKYFVNSEMGDVPNSYYTFNGYINTNVAGKYSIEVSAIDSSDNISFEYFDVVVTSHGKENSIKNVAYSLLGKSYVYGGVGPDKFDCSGFVQYVFRCNGFNVGRSATDQLYDGYGVSYDDIMIGDIIVWGYDTNNITHTAIYVGNGLMIHAANPSEGVIINNVAGWGDYDGVHIVSVRRLS